MAAHRVAAPDPMAAAGHTAAAGRTAFAAAHKHPAVVADTEAAAQTEAVAQTEAAARAEAADQVEAAVAERKTWRAAEQSPPPVLEAACRIVCKSASLRGSDNRTAYNSYFPPNNYNDMRQYMMSALYHMRLEIDIRYMKLYAGV